MAWMLLIILVPACREEAKEGGPPAWLSQPALLLLRACAPSCQRAVFDSWLCGRGQGVRGGRCTRAVDRQQVHEDGKEGELALGANVCRAAVLTL